MMKNLGEILQNNPAAEGSSRAETLFNLAEQEFTRARQIDAQQDTPNRIEDFSLINARE